MECKISNTVVTEILCAYQVILGGNFMKNLSTVNNVLTQTCDSIRENSRNTISLTGKIVSEVTLYIDSFNCNLYTFDIEVPRSNDIVDIIPIYIPEKLHYGITKGLYVTIEGQIRSDYFSIYHRYKSYNYVLVNLITILSEESLRKIEMLNQVVLHGYIYSDPIYRSSLFEKGTALFILSINRNYKRKDCIPIVIWGKDALYCSNLVVGSEIEVIGHLHSREYSKKICQTVESRITYEVFANDQNLFEFQQDLINKVI